MLPTCPPLPTSSYLSKEDVLLGRSLLWKKTQQLISWNIKQWPGVLCAGGTEVWQLRGESWSDWAPPAQAPGPRTAQLPPYLSGYPGSGTVGLPAKAAAPGRVCSARQLLRLKAELPCASAAITSSPSLQPQDEGSVRRTSPLLMCVDQMPAPALPPALTHQPTPHLLPRP